MKGDFSKYSSQNLGPFDAVLQQQGRVLLDSDWNHQAAITTSRSELSHLDIIGKGQAAVPLAVSTSFKVESARLDVDNSVVLEIFPGRAWVDGLLVQLPPNPEVLSRPVSRKAHWLPEPFQVPPGDGKSVGAGVRDAVILEVKREVIHGFQMPEELIEPALGGVDTTERLTTVCGFSLYRLGENESCAGLADLLTHKPEQHGKLSVSLQPSVKVEGDCPVDRRGGYTGLEHQLYRVEIARTTSAKPHFLWSRNNGGWVGRGNFDGPGQRVVLRDNQQAIAHSGHHQFYLEVLSLDSKDGRWRVSYGCEANLVSDTELALALDPHFGTIPTGENLVFRLWDGIQKLDAFPAGPDPHELEEGIFLQFPSLPDAYMTEDYWTFSVKAAGLPNDEVLLQDQAPTGPIVHRVPIAELMWNDLGEVGFHAGSIEDCRKIIRPLALQGGCCSFVVGDGKTSHGDFDSLEEALQHLPEAGGRLCLLAGLHETNLVIKGRENIIIHGCGKHSTLSPRPGQGSQSVISILDSVTVLLQDLDVVCMRGSAIYVHGKGPDTCNNITIENCNILGFNHGIWADEVTALRLISNQVMVCDSKDAGPCISITGDNMLVRDNRLTLARKVLQRGMVGDFAVPLDPSDHCTDPELLYRNPKLFKAYLKNIWVSPFLNRYKVFYLGKGLGGLEVGGGSRDVRIENNHIEGGQGNGISLGTQADIRKLAQVYLAPDFSKWVINSRGNALIGNVKSTGNIAQVGVALNFTADNGQVFSETSQEAMPFMREAGSLNINLNTGSYRVAPATPGYRIVDILANSSEQLNSSFDIIVEKSDSAGGTPGFIYDLFIHENRVEKMGGSAIGSARLVLENSASLPGSREKKDNTQVFTADSVFQNLIISNNQLRENLRDTTGLSIFNPSGETGVGGIALGTGEGLTISGNLVEDNGIVHRQAVCGLYGAAVERAEIYNNTIRNNGPFKPGDSGALQVGPRGGIFINAYTNAPSQAETSANGRFAARIHDNVVDHPVGPALVVRAIGPLSIQGNRFNCERAGISGWGNRAVIIFNDGGGLELSDRNPSSFLHGTQLAATPVDNPGSVSTASSSEASTPDRAVSAAASSIHRFKAGFSSPHFLPEGPVLFLGNQIRIGQNFSASEGVLISVEDDLNVQNNQLEALSPSLTRACLVSGRNVTVTGNRIRQLLTNHFYSLSLLSNSRLFNNTSFNQTSHCLFVATTDQTNREDMVYSQLNQVHFRTNCADLSGTLKQFWLPLGNRLFRGNAKRRTFFFEDPSGLNTLVHEIAAMRGIGFLGFKLYRGSYLASLQAESQRLSLRFGEAHPYGSAIQYKLDLVSQQYAALSAENQISLIETEPMSAGMTQIHGRITDTLGQGLIGLKVHFVDEAQKSLTNLGQGETNSYGYYSLLFSDAAFDAYSQSLSKGVFLVLSSNGGKEVYRRFQPVTVEKNQTNTVELSLDPGDLGK